MKRRTISVKLIWQCSPNIRDIGTRDRHQLRRKSNDYEWDWPPVIDKFKTDSLYKQLADLLYLSHPDGEKDAAGGDTAEKNGEKPAEVKIENGTDAANASGNEGIEFVFFLSTPQQCGYLSTKMGEYMKVQVLL